MSSQFKFNFKDTMRLKKQNVSQSDFTNLNFANTHTQRQDSMTTLSFGSIEPVTTPVTPTPIKKSKIISNFIHNSLMPSLTKILKFHLHHIISMSLLYFFLTDYMYTQTHTSKEVAAMMTHLFTSPIIIVPGVIVLVIIVIASLMKPTPEIDAKIAEHAAKEKEIDEAIRRNRRYYY